MYVVRRLTLRLFPPFISSVSQVPLLRKLRFPPLLEETFEIAVILARIQTARYSVQTAECVFAHEDHDF